MPMQASQSAMRGGSSSSSRPTPAAVMSSANAGQHVADGEDRPGHGRRAAGELEHPEVDLRDGVEVQPPQRGRQQHRRDQRRPRAGGGHVGLDRPLAGLDDHLAEQDDQEQAEPLGEVMRVQRLRRVGRGERLEVVVAPGLARGVAVLGQHRPRLQADADRPQHVAERLRHPDRDQEQPRRGQAARVIRPRSRSVPPPATAVATASTTRVTARASAKTVLSPVEAGSIATAATPPGRCRPGSAAAAGASPRRGGCRARRSPPTSTTAS